MLFKTCALKNFTNYTGKKPMLKSPLNKTASPKSCSFIKKRLQHQRCPPAKLVTPPRTSISKKHIQWLQPLEKGKT